MYDIEVKAIRARLAQIFPEAAYRLPINLPYGSEAKYIGNREFIIQAPHDIAYLLDRYEELQIKMRMLEEQRD